MFQFNFYQQACHRIVYHFGLQKSFGVNMFYFLFVIHNYTEYN